MEDRRDDRRRERGQSLLEFALLVPVLLIILAGILDLGRLYYVYVAVTDAAAEGAAYAAMYPDDSAGIVARAQSASQGFVTVGSNQVTLECPTCPNPTTGDVVTVTVDFTFTLATPFINFIVPEGVLPLRAVASEAVIGGKIH